MLRSEEDRKLKSLEKNICASETGGAYVLCVLRCPSRYVENLRGRAHRYCRYEEMGWTRRRHAPGWVLPEDEALPYAEPDEEIVSKKQISHPKRDERKPRERIKPEPAPRKVKKGLTRPRLNTPQPEDFLKRALANGPRIAEELFKEAAQLGFTQNQMFEAKYEIGARARNEEDTGWIWSLPKPKPKPIDEDEDC